MACKEPRTRRRQNQTVGHLNLRRLEILYHLWQIKAEMDKEYEASNIKAKAGAKETSQPQIRTQQNLLHQLARQHSETHTSLSQPPISRTSFT
jgi:hypothetical protein